MLLSVGLCTLVDGFPDAGQTHRSLTIVSGITKNPALLKSDRLIRRQLESSARLRAKLRHPTIGDGGIVSGFTDCLGRFSLSRMRILGVTSPDRHNCASYPAI